jgi:hypothetical protein
MPTDLPTPTTQKVNSTCKRIVHRHGEGVRLRHRITTFESWADEDVECAAIGVSFGKRSRYIRVFFDETLRAEMLDTSEDVKGSRACARRPPRWSLHHPGLFEPVARCPRDPLPVGRQDREPMGDGTLLTPPATPRNSATAHPTGETSSTPWPGNHAPRCAAQYS